MSDFGWAFSIQCPECGLVTKEWDECETDDWSELFVFSGKSIKNSRDVTYRCEGCKKIFPIDSLYAGRHIKTEAIDGIKAWLDQCADLVLDQGEIGDHGWEPDIEAAIDRYSMLYPDDAELKALRTLYYRIYHAPGTLVKFEPSPQTTEVLPEMIIRKNTLKKVYLPNGLKKIGAYTFSRCYRLADIFIPDTVTEIGRAAFQDCRYLRKAHSSKALRLIGEEAFSGCGLLGSFFFPDSLEQIGERSFYKCEQLEKAFIPGSCTCIGSEAFRGCSCLRLISIPETTVCIGDDAFADAPELTIEGAVGSAAHSYANSHSIPFKPFTRE